MGYFGFNTETRSKKIQSLIDFYENEPIKGAFKQSVIGNKKRDDKLAKIKIDINKWQSKLDLTLNEQDYSSKYTNVKMQESFKRYHERQSELNKQTSLNSASRNTLTSLGSSSNLSTISSSSVTSISSRNDTSTNSQSSGDESKQQVYSKRSVSPSHTKSFYSFLNSYRPTIK